MRAAPPAALEALARRLDPVSSAPVAVAFSGGGDSLALLLAARSFAERSGRPLVALHVDHRLQPASATWADGAERTARRLGARFVRLDWTGRKPDAGVPAAARAARHRLIAEAARRLGAPVVLMGHTLDDQLENALMRGAGLRVGVLADWSPSPVWPEGRGVFLCRPLLNLRRADLRRWLQDQGLSWLDDPANDDLRHPRARARRALAGGVEPPAPAAARPRSWAGLWRAEPWGGVALDRPRLLRADPGEVLRLLQAAAVCVSGAERLSRPARAEGLLARLNAAQAFVATLGGARIEVDADRVVLEREAGEAARGGLAPMVLRSGAPMVWDGRFEMTAEKPDLMVEALRGRGAQLDAGDRAVLVGIPAAARPALPLWRNLDDHSSSPRLALAIPRAHLQCNDVRCRALCGERLAAAGGVVTKEAEIGTNARMADAGLPSYVEAGSKD
jgi:tRNA(Ile)-lysidine synthase